MTISRGQMPRQMYGLGSLVKKAVRGVRGAVKGIGRTIKKNPLLAAAAFNFAPMLIPGGASTFLGGKVYIYAMDYITHVGEHAYCGRFFDMLTALKRVDVDKKIK